MRQTRLGFRIRATGFAENPLLHRRLAVLHRMAMRHHLNHLPRRIHHPRPDHPQRPNLCPEAMARHITYHRPHGVQYFL